jgi:hypothetical protein
MATTRPLINRAEHDRRRMNVNMQRGYLSNPTKPPTVIEDINASNSNRNMRPPDINTYRLYVGSVMHINEPEPGCSGNGKGNREDYDEFNCEKCLNSCGNSDAALDGYGNSISCPSCGYVNGESDNSDRNSDSDSNEFSADCSWPKTKRKRDTQEEEDKAHEREIQDSAAAAAAATATIAAAAAAATAIAAAAAAATIAAAAAATATATTATTTATTTTAATTTAAATATTATTTATTTTAATAAATTAATTATTATTTTAATTAATTTTAATAAAAGIIRSDGTDVIVGQNAIPSSSHLSAARKKKKRTKVMWSEAETEAVRQGQATHGCRWAIIRQDPLFRIILQNRTNVDIKDRFRTIMAAK